MGTASTSFGQPLCCCCGGGFPACLSHWAFPAAAARQSPGHTLLPSISCLAVRAWSLVIKISKSVLRSCQRNLLWELCTSPRCHLSASASRAAPCYPVGGKCHCCPPLSRRLSALPSLGSRTISPGLLPSFLPAPVKVCLALHPFQYPHFTVTQPQVIPRLNPPSSLQHLQAFLAQTLSVLLPSLADTEPVAFPPISHAVNAAVCSVAQDLLN